MLQFIQENIATIIVALIITLLIVLAIRKIIRDKKAGIGSCGCKCSECPHNTDCTK